MAQPTGYTPANDFSELEAADPADGLATIGTKLDAEFSAINTTLDGTLTNLALIQRDDGALKNGIVTSASLASGIAIGVENQGAWVTATAYAVDDAVLQSNKLYRCLTAHTSGTFSTDLAASKWVLLFDFATLIADAITASSVDLTALTNETTIDLANDELLMRDASESANNAVTVQVLWNSAGTLTAETAVDSADSIPIYDTSASATDRATVANVLKAVTTLTDATIVATDEILFCDVSDSNNVKKDTVQGILDLVTGATAINTLPAETAPAADDLLNIWDTSEGAANNMTFQNFFKVINSIPADASPDTAADYVVTYDASAAAAKKVLLSAFAGGVSATDSQAGVVELATAAEVATGTDTARVPSVSVMGSHPSAAKFWASIAGSGASINDSYNVTSITDSGTGDVTITIATDFANANWCCVATVEQSENTGEASARQVSVKGATMSTGAVELLCYDDTATTKNPVDPASNYFVVGFGDQ